jgi:hypothetical protein
MVTNEELRNAAIGAVVTIATSFTGVGPVLGGAVASYLHGRDGARIGALSGVLSSVPMVLLGIPLLLIVGLILGVGGDLFAFSILGMIVIVVGLGFAVGITVVLSTFGGWIGIYVLEETDLGRSPTTASTSEDEATEATEPNQEP